VKQCFLSGEKVLEDECFFFSGEKVVVRAFFHQKKNIGVKARRRNPPAISVFFE
jgi:hypothetical protein